MNVRCAAITLRRASDLLQHTCWKQQVSIQSSYHPAKHVLSCHQPQIIRCASTYPIPAWETPINQRLIKYRRKFGFHDYSDSAYKTFAQELYLTVDGIDFDLFFKEFKLPDTFHSCFLVLELHSWILMVRARALEDGEGEAMVRFITEEMWRDVEIRATKLEGRMTKPLKRDISGLYDEMVLSIAAYDEGLLTTDWILANAVWHRFFCGKSDDIKAVELLVKYIRRSVHHFDNYSREQFLLLQNIAWLPLHEE